MRKLVHFADSHAMPSCFCLVFKFCLSLNIIITVYVVGMSPSAKLLLELLLPAQEIARACSIST